MRLWLLLVACSSSPVDNVPEETDTGIDTDEDTDAPRLGWLAETVPVQADFQSALFLDTTWIFGTEPTVALQHTDNGWIEGPHPAGGPVQSAASSDSAGVALTADGALHTWTSTGWQPRSTWSAPEAVHALAIGTTDEAYVVTEQTLYVVRGDSADAHAGAYHDVWASPGGGALLVSDEGVFTVGPARAPALIAPAAEDRWPTHICGRDEDHVWVFGQSGTRGKLAAYYDGTEWAWDAEDWAISSENFTGTWCSDTEPALVSIDHQILPSAPLYNRGWRGLTRSYSSEGWGDAQAQCRAYTSGLMGPINEGWPCALHGKGDVGLILGADGLVKRAVWGEGR